MWFWRIVSLNLSFYNFIEKKYKKIKIRLLRSKFLEGMSFNPCFHKWYSLPVKGKLNISDFSLQRSISWKRTITVNCNCNYCYLFTHKKALTSSLVSRETPLRARERTNHKLNWHYGINARIGTRATLVGGECIHHCATLAQGKILRQNLPGNWVILIFSGQKPCTRII